MKSNLSSSLFFTAILSITSSAFFSQNSPTKISSIQLEVEPTNQVNELGDSLFDYRFKINLIDTINVFKTNITVGTTYKGKDIFKEKFQIYLGEEDKNPANMKREGLIVEGEIKNVVPSIFFWEATTEDFQGNKSLPYRKQM